MGLHYYIRSLAAVAVVLGLLLLTWNKATEVVREVADLESITSQVRHTKSITVPIREKDEKSESFEGATMVETDIMINDHTEMSTTSPASSETFTTPDYTGSESTQFHSGQASADEISLSVTRTLQAETTAWSKVTTPKTAPNSVTDTLTNINYITEANKQEYKKSSKEKHHVAFLKVHKTGSSTVQNIFLRFGDSHNLTFILPHDDKEKAETKFPNMISYSNSLNDDNIVPPPVGRHFEMLCCHVIYNRTQFEKYLPADTSYIGLVREPVARLESSFRYFNLFPNVSLSEFATNPLLHDKGMHSMANNRMAFEFGFPLNLFPNSKEKTENMQEEMKKYIDRVMNEFDLIMINEKMDESLVLMKRILNWHIKDIMYMKQLVAKHETRRFLETDIKKLKSYLYLDFALYEAAKEEFDAKIEKFGEDFKDEVRHFTEEKAKIQEFCDKHVPEGRVLSLGGSKWDSAYNVTLQECELYKKFEIKFIQDIRRKQYGKLGI